MTPNLRNRLVKFGHLTPVAPSSRWRETVFFHRTAVQEFILTLTANAERLYDIPTGSMTISDAIRRIKDFSTVHKVILSGQVWVGLIGDELRYSSILVQPTEISEVIRRDYDEKVGKSNIMTFREFTKALGVSRTMATILRDEGVIEAAASLNPTTMMMRMAYDVDQAKTFRREFITLSELLEVMDRPVTELRRELSRYRVEAVWDNRSPTATIYRRMI